MESKLVEKVQKKSNRLQRVVFYFPICFESLDKKKAKAKVSKVAPIIKLNVLLLYKVFSKVHM